MGDSAAAKVQSIRRFFTVVVPLAAVAEILGRKDKTIS
jgi:hypothetical protein